MSSKVFRMEVDTSVSGLCPAGQYLKRDDSTSAETSCGPAAAQAQVQ